MRPLLLLLCWVCLSVVSGCGSTTATPCTPQGTPITHSADLTASETWATGVHLVPATLHVKSGAKLTIAACTEVRLAADSSILVDASALGLEADGTASAPVTFVRSDAAKAWGSIQVSTPATAKLSYTTLSQGGGTRAHGTGADHEGASLVVNGDTTAFTLPVGLTVDHLTISGSTGLGLFLRSARIDPSSSALTISGAGWYPVYGGVGAVASLPGGSYTGNGVDQILMQIVSAAVYDDAQPLAMDATLADHGVPYLVGTVPTSLRVGTGKQGDPSALLTIAANVTLLFTPQGPGGLSQLQVRGQTDGTSGAPQGALVVQGTASAPVTFASAAPSPAPGDWQGLYFAYAVDPRTSISNARILDAGGASGTVGVCESAPGSGQGIATCALVINVFSAPSEFLHSSTIADSGNCGVYRAWRVDQVDFTASNTFTHVPGCVQSNVPNPSNLCSVVPCPTAP